MWYLDKLKYCYMGVRTYICTAEATLLIILFTISIESHKSNIFVINCILIYSCRGSVSFAPGAAESFLIRSDC